MTNLADTFPFTGTIPAVGFPAYVGATPPANPAVGSIWFNPTTSIAQVYTATGWVATASGGTTLPQATAQGKFLLSGPGGAFAPVWDDADCGRYA